MRKLLFILLTLCMSIFTLQVSAQQIVEIGDGGTTTNSYLPFYSFYNNTLSEQIYTPDEVTMGGTISSIAFYNGGSEKSPLVKIYMINTDQTQFSSTTDWFTVTASDLVFQGTVTFAANAWTTITLDAPFDYDGVSNLGLIFDANLQYSSGFSGRVFTSTSNCAMYVYSDPTDYDAVGATYTASSRLSVKNQIKLEITPLNVTCPRPTHTTVSGITAYEATLTWSPGDAETEWDIYYTTSSTDIPDSNTVAMETSYDTTFTLISLTPNTYYYAYVRANCGNEYSKWKSVTPFRTQCVDISTLPYSENFDTYGTGSTAYPTCWSKINTYTSSQMPYVNSTNYQGTGSLYFYAGTANTYNIAIMEALDPSLSINNLQLTFMYRASNSTDRLIVGVMDDITDASTFTPVATIYPYQGSASTWEERVVNFSNYDGYGTNIAFKNEYTGTSSYAYIDNLVLDYISECNRPTDVLISNYTSEGALIDWTPAGDENSWEVVAVASGADVNTGTPETATDHPFMLSGLNANTAYDIYVRASCSNGESEWSVKRSFTTNPNCTVARNVTVSQVTTNSALVTWDNALFGASDYTVGFSVAGQNNWTTQTVSGTQYMLSDLTINTEYDVFVLTNCDLGEADSVFASFTTRSCMVGGDLQIGEGTSTTGYLPEYCLYNYSYSQQIYLASDMNGAAEISSIAFEASSIENASRHLKIYLMHTSAANSNWLNASNATLVYDGTPTLTTGWNTFNFTSPFQYNGTDNLAVIVIDATGSWSGTNSFYCHTTSQSLAHYDYQDDTPYSINTIPGSDGYGDVTNSRNNVIFGVPCDSLATCVAPNPYITEVTDNSITVAWTPGNTETSWELEYTADTIWNSEGTVTSPYTLSGLTDNTTYTIRVRSICGTGDESEPAVTSGRTACSVVNIPYTETFEDAPGSGYGNMVDCWTTGTNYSSSYPYTSSSYSHAGTYSAYFYGTSSYYSYMATPEFDANVALNTLQVAFWARKSTANYFIQVGVMTDPNDYSTFEQVGGNLTPNTTNTWQLMEVNLDEYTGNGHYIAFRIPQSYTSYMYIDDINIDVIPTCSHVENITVSGIGATEATVEWTEGGDESSWEVAFVPGTGAVDMDTVATNTASSPSYTTTSLEQNTIYTVYVRAICGSGSSSWMSAEFMTSQIPATLPYFCDFEDATQVSEFAFVNGNQPHQWVVGTATNNGGNHAMYISNDYGTTHTYSVSSSSTVWAYRDIEFPANPSGYTLSFDWHCYGESGYDFMNVYIGTPAMVTAGVPSSLYSGSTANPAGTIALQTTTNSSYPKYFNLNTNYVTYTTTLPGLAETTVQRIYFLWRNDGSSGTMPPAAVDNISISPIYCDAPDSLTISNITSTEAEISWTSTANSSVLSYKGPNDNDWIEIDPATSPQTLTNLDPITAYMVRVANNCDDGVSISPYITTSFMTACDVVTTLPYTENFDSYTASTSTRANCWSYPVTYSNGAPYVTSSYYSSQPNSFHFQSETTIPTTAVTPQFAEDINNLRVKFMLKAESTTSSGTFEVGVLSDPAADSTFESVRIIQPANTNWNQYVVDFDSTTLTGGNRYIAFRQHSNSSIYYYWLDDVSVMPIPDCADPSNLDALITTTDLTLSWDANPDVSSWEVYVYESNQTPDYSQAVQVNTNTYTDQLTSGTSYTAMVRTICPTGGYSDWVTVSFTMLSNEPALVPYFHDFEDGEENAAWTFVNGTQSNKWYIGQPSNETDSVLFISNNGTSEAYNTSSASNVWAYRDLMFPDGAEFALDIKWMAYGELCCDYLNVFIGSPTDVMAGSSTMPADATQVGGTLNGQSNWQHLTATFNSSYANSTKRLFFLWHNDSSVGSSPAAVIDSIVITASNCGSPYNLTVANITAYGADFSFSAAMQTDNAWEYAICTSGESPDNAAITGQASSTTFSVSTLTPATSYMAYVRTVCDEGGYSNWSAPVSLTTPPTCPAVSNVAVTTTSTTSVTLDWQPGDSETSWEIAYGTDIADPTSASATIVTANAHPYEVQNLNSGTAYQFYVRAVCSATDNSTWSSVVGAATQCAGAVSLPYSENFDSYVGSTYNDPNGIAPACWTTYSENTSYGAPHIISASSSYHYAQSGNSMVFTCSSSGTDAYAALPTFDQPLNTLHLNFWRAMESTTYGQLTVGYVTDLNDLDSSFVQVATIPSVSTSGDTISIDFTGSDIPANGNICFHWYKDGTYYSCCIDNVNVSVAGSGPVVTDPTVATNAATSIAQTSATLNATITNPDNVTISACGFEWKAISDANYTVVTLPSVAATMTHNLTGLTANTNYTYKAFITFNGNTVYGVDMPFTTLAEGQTCNVPTNLTATATAYNSADVTWTAGGSETAWNLQYKTAAATNWSANIPVTTTSYQLTGLTAETAYQVRVQANCGNDGTSDWATANFTTPAEPVEPCDAPTGLTIGNVTTTSATATWTPGGSETAWNIQYKLQSASQWQEATVQTTSYDIEGLSAASTYDVRVKAICSADNQSDFVTTTFTTQTVGIDNITLANSINLMPNPADNYIDLTINSNVDVKEAVVYNAFGQMIQTVVLTDNYARIDLSDMAAGMYFVRVNGDNVSATKKFIKR